MELRSNPREIRFAGRALLALLFFVGISPLAFGAGSRDLEEETRQIASELRCAVCQNLSVADSPSELAQQMRAVILEKLKEGKTRDEIKAYFVSKYGEWILLAPTPKGFSIAIWVLPFLVLLVGTVLVYLLARRWVRKKDRDGPVAVDPVWVERVRRETAQDNLPEASVDPEDESPEARLLRERARLYTAIRELEFDRNAGRLSESDCLDLRRDLEAQAGAVLKEIEARTPTPPNLQPAAAQETSIHPRVERPRSSYRGWQLALGGGFLLVFGVTLGVLLTKSLRPRQSQGDSITGDFLTGTSPGDDLNSVLARGRDAFAKQDWPAAIDAFKKALATDPNQPEANSHMGLILSQAGHAEGALLAFNRALASHPGFPLALWGKGLVLFHERKDYRAAREAWESLLPMVSQAGEREGLQKLIADARRLEQQGGEKPPERAAHPGENQTRLSGAVHLAPGLRAIKVGARDVLFIIARSSASPGGPPLAVKKIERPSFPVPYSLGDGDVMVAGMPFSGKVSLSARLDRDGNPTTRGPEDLFGERKQPIEVGSAGVDIVIDQSSGDAPKTR